LIKTAWKFVLNRHQPSNCLIRKMRIFFYPKTKKLTSPTHCEFYLPKWLIFSKFFSSCSRCPAIHCFCKLTGLDVKSPTPVRSWPDNLFISEGNLHLTSQFCGVVLSPTTIYNMVLEPLHDSLDHPSFMFTLQIYLFFELTISDLFGDQNTKKDRWDENKLDFSALFFFQN